MKHFPWILGSLVALGLAGCQRATEDAAWWEREGERIGLMKRLELAEYRHARAAGSIDAEGEMVRLKAAVSAGENALKAARARRADLALSLATLEKELAEFRVASVDRYRQQLVGTTFSELRLASGRVYLDAAVTAVGDAGVLIRHRDGSARLGYAVLSGEQREFFAMNQEAAQAAEELERAHSLAYERALDRQLAVLADDQRQRSAESAALERRLSEERRASATAAMVASNRGAASARSASALSAPARAFGSGTSYRYRSYRNHRSPYRTTYFVLPCRQPLPSTNFSRTSFFPPPGQSTSIRPANSCPPFPTTFP